MTTKSTKNQTYPHINTPIEIERVLLRTYGCGSVLSGRLEQILMLMVEISVCRSTRTSLYSCGGDGGSIRERGYFGVCLQ